MREGYKKTEVGIIPEDWEAVLLSDICEVNPKKDILENDDEVAFLPMEQVSNSGRIIKIDTRKYEEVSKGYTPFKNKDVLLAKITPCFENGKRAIVENLQYKMGFGSTEFHVLRSLEERSIPKYLYYCIDTHRFKELAERNMTGSAGQKRVPTTFLKDFKLPIPPLKEQEKIAEILSTVDSQINDSEKLIEKSKELKKGLMQKLLTKGIGHSEFKNTEVGEIPVDWEVKTVGECSQVTKLAGFEFTEYIEYREDGEIIALRALNLKNGKLDLSDIKRIDKHVSENLQRSKLFKGDMLFSYVGTVGEVALIEEGNKYHLAPNVAKVTFNEFIIPKFAVQYFNSIKMENEIRRYVTTTSQPALSMENIRKMKLVIPPINEQEKISQILSLADNNIEIYQNKKQNLEEIKKGLIQKLLTGKIRCI